MGDTMDRILEHCPKICKLNAEDTYFRVVSFTNFFGASAIAAHLEDITEEEIGFAKECSSM
jgi:hypothetical protein